ncbi:unnamed protein product [Phytophthora fragariaefolia]|uniref:Unnamed protein product n=1 Tax=Phytophthora fragariaefolia TaxID=1490495 RepID=A0A9W6TRC8_9STRA|nr:unnamed protein product [Phytophthora fragariaefolia]
MDFMVALPETESGFDSIMVIVDQLTKRAKFIEAKTTASAEYIAELFLKNYVKDHGLPKSIISDGDPKFTLKLWLSVMSALQTKHNLSAAFRPQPDDQTERTIDSLKIIFGVSSTQSKTTGINVCIWQNSPTTDEYTHRSVQRDSYKLAMSGNLKLHSVFHTSLLKDYQKDDKRQQKPSMVVLADGTTEGQLVEAVLGYRKRRGKEQYKIHWLGESIKEATWEPIENLNQIPELIAEYWNSKKGSRVMDARPR